MKLRELSLGPIIGATAPTQIRLFGRGHAELIGGQPRRCFAVARIKPLVAGGRWSSAKIVKMNPNFDVTAVVVFEGLLPDTEHAFQFGVAMGDGEPDSLRHTRLDWSEAHEGTAKTASADAHAPRDIVFGSCRYILRTWMGSFFDSRGDKTFGSICEQIEAGRPVDQMLMVGDQIYADDLNFYRPDEHLGKFYERYRESFGQKHIRRLMSQVSTCMTLDDHEIEDNWPEKASTRDWVTKYPVAMHAYLTYQASHSPLFQVTDGRLSGVPTKLWFDYADGCCEFFVTDSRTERRYDQGELLGRTQLDALKAWLSNDSGRVKIVVTSVPFFPDPRGQSRDKWSGFPVQRSEILEYVAEHEIPKVVFLSGDVHCSLSATLTQRNNPGVKLISIVSSAFFWPYPHESARDFQLEGEIDAGDAGRFDLAVEDLVYSGDNFTRLSVTPEQVSVEVYQRKGERIGPPVVHRF
ncbi:MAG: alkaline phosphatase D family protein [Planctomycetota bacterium]